MPFQPVDMDDCGQKCKCLSGPNAGTLYPCKKPCEDDYEFKGEDCSCEPTFCTVKRTFDYTISRSGGSNLGFTSTEPPTWEWNGSVWEFTTIGCGASSVTEIAGTSDEIFTIIDEQVGLTCGVGQCYAIQIYKYYRKIGVAAYGVGYAICETTENASACTRQARQIPCYVTYEWIDLATGTSTTDSPTALCDAVPREVDFILKALEVTVHYENYDDEVRIVDTFQTDYVTDKNLGDGTQWDARLNGNVEVLRSGYSSCGYEADFGYEPLICEDLANTGCDCDLTDPTLDMEGEPLECADSYTC